MVSRLHQHMVSEAGCKYSPLLNKLLELSSKILRHPTVTGFLYTFPCRPRPRAASPEWTLGWSTQTNRRGYSTRRRWRPDIVSSDCRSEGMVEGRYLGLGVQNLFFGCWDLFEIFLPALVFWSTPTGVIKAWWTSTFFQFLFVFILIYTYILAAMYKGMCWQWCHWGACFSFCSCQLCCDLAKQDGSSKMLPVSNITG